MSNLLIHPKTQSQLELTIKGGAHAILITGQPGAGKSTVAKDIASKLLQTKLDNAPYFLRVTPDGKSVSIEQIRDLQKFVQLKTTGTNEIRRVAVIDQADTMTTEAQNALLKLLEEPPEDTVLLLTASKPHQLKPTIHSRLQTVQLLAPTKTATLDYFMKQGKTGTEIERAFMLSNGQVGLMTALLENIDEHALANSITTAKELYGMSPFERLTQVDALSKDKDGLSNLLFACKRICITALEQAAAKAQQKQVQSWHRQLSLVLGAEESLKHNPNTKLLLTDLFIQM